MFLRNLLSGRTRRRPSASHSAPPPEAPTTTGTASTRSDSPAASPTPERPSSQPQKFQNDETRDAPELRRRPSLARRLSRTLFDSSKSADEVPQTFVVNFKQNDMDGLEDIVGLAVCDSHALAITKDGRLMGVGDNSSGQLDASRKPDAFNAAPKTIADVENVACVSTSKAYSAATTRDGLVLSWGFNCDFVLGHSKTSVPPARVPARLLDGSIRREKTVQVACSEHTLYLLTDRGVVWSCGAGRNEALASPMHGILQGIMIAHITAGPNHALFTSATGVCFGFGSNEFAALGQDPEHASMLIYSRPVHIPFSELVIHAACGAEHSAFVTASGQPSPVLLDLAKPVRQVACGAFHTVVVFVDGTVHNFGSGSQPDLTLGPGKRAYLATAGGFASSFVVVDSAADVSLFPRLGPRMNRLDASTLTRLAVDAEASGRLGALVGALSELHVACLNRSFLLPGFEVDQKMMPPFAPGQTSVTGLDVAEYTSTMQAVWNAFTKADRAWLMIKTDELLSELLEISPHVHMSDQLRAFFLAWINPYVESLPMTMLIKLVKAWAALPARQLQQLCEWTCATLDDTALRQRVIRPLLSIVDVAAISCDWTDRAGVAQAIHVLSAVREAAGDRLCMSDFYAVQPSKWAQDTMVEEFVRFLHAEQKRHDGTPPSNFVSLFDHPFVLSAETKRDVMQAEAQYRQVRAAILQLAQDHSLFLEFVVRRDALVPDVLKCVSQAQEQGEILKPLRVVFVGEEGLDFGGVKKEFFELLSAQLFKDCFKMTDSTPGFLWFDPEFTDESKLELVGTLIGLAIYNSTLLDVHFPLALYSSLLGLPHRAPTLNDLAGVDPTLSHGLQAMLNLPRNEFNEAFDGLTFEGLAVSGEEKLVSYETREEYALLRAKNFMYDSVESKMAALVRGFRSVCGDAKAMRLFRPSELELALVGVPMVNLEEIKAHATYEGGFDEKNHIISWFWSILQELSEDQRATWLGFTTGSTRTPIGGSLSVKIQRMGPDSDQLPTSHTCFNTLLLPDYSSRENCTTSSFWPWRTLAALVFARKR